MTYDQLKVLGITIDRGALADGFKNESAFEPEVLKTYKPGRTPKTPSWVVPEDLSALNSPQFKRLQAQVKARWARMTPEERAAARAQRSLNANCPQKRRRKM